MPATVTVFSMTLLLLASSSSGQKTCDIGVGQYALCQCEMSDGSGTIDLSAYANTNGNPSLESTSPNGFGYHLNLCFPVKVGGVCAATQTSAGCQSRDLDGDEWSMGSYETASFVVDNTDTVSLHFSNGDDNRGMEIQLICDENRQVDQHEFVFDREDFPGYFYYYFKLTSKCACPHKSGVCGKAGGGGGGGSSDDGGSDPGVVGIVLMVLAFAAFVTYFIVGAVFLRVKHQKSGTDLIIHKEFWKDFPFLVKDGVMFTVSPCVNAAKGSGYSKM